MSVAVFFLRQQSSSSLSLEIEASGVCHENGKILLNTNEKIRFLFDSSGNRNEVLEHRIKTYVEEDRILTALDLAETNPKVLHKDKNWNSKDRQDCNMSSTLKQNKTIQQPSKIVCPSEITGSLSAQQVSEQSRNIPRAVDFRKSHPPQSFNLFDQFTFSMHASSQEESRGCVQSRNEFEETALPVNLMPENRLDQQMGNQCSWVDDYISPSFANLSLQPENEKIDFIDPYKSVGFREQNYPYSTPFHNNGYPSFRGSENVLRSNTQECGKCIGPMNQASNANFQPVIWPEQGFPFYQPGPTSTLPSGVPYVYSPLSRICVFPQQTLLESWSHNQHDNRACPGCLEQMKHLNAHRMSESFHLNCCAQQNRFIQLPVEDYFETRAELDPEQQSNSSYQTQASSKTRRHKSKAAYEKPKQARKIPNVLKINSRRRIMTEKCDTIEEQNSNYKEAQLDKIPLGARPILSAKK